MNKKSRFIDRLEKAIETIIMPQFPEVSEVYVERVETYEGNIGYVVNYTISKSINRDQAESLKGDTHNIFNMLTPNPNERMQMYFYFPNNR